jgi:hypothetical protein
MKICSKCKVEKELDQFHKYFHSTQNKERIRGYCKSCFRHQQRIVKQNIRNKKITQPVEDMTQPEVLPIEYDTSIYKFCIGCDEWKVIDTDFYRYSKKTCNKRCKKCENKIRSDMYYDDKEDGDWAGFANYHNQQLQLLRYLESRFPNDPVKVMNIHQIWSNRARDTGFYNSGYEYYTG